MARLGLADRSELLRWADSRGAPGDLPRLIRRLILETGRGVLGVSFPGGEGITTGGWDGTAQARDATAYVPAGLSLWELSVEKSVNRKANEDYAKRLSTPDGSLTRNCTYVAVSVRPWQKRREWASGKAGDDRWKDVRAYGVDDLETWLGSAPVTHAWLSELLGLHPHGLLPVETWWASWSSATRPPFPSAAILAGRSAADEALRAELARPGQIITVRGASREDVVAFVTALGLSDAEGDGGSLLARTVVIDNVEAWRRLRDHDASLIVIPKTAEVTGDIAPGSTHHVIVPVVGGGSADITLPPIDSQGAKEALEAADLKDRLAEEIGRLARLSLLAARRRIASKPELHRPRWAAAPATQLVRRVLLAGRWNENSSADLRAVSGLFGAEYETLRDELASLMSESDPLLARLGALVGLVSEFDAWLLLSGELRKEDLELFQAAALGILGELDPVLELPPKDRWQASLLGKERPHSGDLRLGVATTLALLGSYGDTVVVGSGLTGQEWASWTVRQVLDGANKDKTCRLWASLRDVLALLAEAAPTDFLEAVHDGLSGVTPLLRDMFVDREDGSALFSDSAHTSLLSALETCAWSPTEFGQAVGLLARLAEVDPGGRLANRPAASLESIFCPWYPQNSVGSERRLAALDGLRERHEPIAWKLMLSMLPARHGVAMPTSAPRFRDWKPEQISVTPREYWAFIEEVCRRLLKDVGTDPARWVSVIDELADLPRQVRADALGQLETLSAEKRLDDTACDQIWESLRSNAAHHREFGEADWALPAEEVARMEEVAKRFEPSTSAQRLAWLFDEHRPDIPDVGRGEGFAAYESALTRLRAEAAAEIAASCDWPQLCDFAIRTKLPWSFGWALAQAGVTEHETKIIELLSADDAADLNFASSYLSKRFRTEGWPWVEKHLRAGDLSPEQFGRLLLATDNFPRAWEVAETMGDEVEAIFWRHFRTTGLGADFPCVETVAQKLLDVGRPGGALDLLAVYIRQGEGGSERAELMATGLEDLLKREPGETDISVLSHYGLREIFSYLERSSLPAERLVRLEWAYLPAFGYDESPPTLSRYLAQDPSFFVDVVSRVYRPRLPEASEDDETMSSEVGGEPDEQQQAIARNGYRLLSEWRTLPGKREDGTVDGEALREWVNEARRLLRAAHRLEIGDAHIGRVLASSPADPDGAWPCVEVRDLLESLQSREMEDAMRVQIYNDRGPTSRGLLDGGDQERALAAKYRTQADRFADQWPRTATVLRDLAQSYERDARRYDEDAERHRRGLDA